MKIGIITTWYERGAAYVSRIYKELLEKEGHCVYIYARAGEMPNKDCEKWNEEYVTRDNRYNNTRINKTKFFRWIVDNKIEIVFFNEQRDFRIIGELKRQLPNIKVGGYVDYYTERTIEWFKLYDFVICNTKRHMQAMKNHPQKYYLPWGTDVSLFKPSTANNKQLTFFHSAGMSTRKGTDILIDAFIDGLCYKKSKLIIHTQLPIESFTHYSINELKEKNIEIIEKTVTAPGLYYLGDVYVYPTRLDGLGLTMYEAASSGLPIITTDFPPMNEAVKEEFGKLVKVEDYYCRKDAYYFPMVICDKEDLIKCMNYYINNPKEVEKQKRVAREYAKDNYDIYSKSKEVSKIFVESKINKLDSKICEDMNRYYNKETNSIYNYFDDLNLTRRIKIRLYNTINKNEK